MKKTDGFTLIELSIVLVILGLVVGGVVGGGSLMQAAENQSIIRKAEGFKTAVNAFMLSYDDIPGDMDNAHDYWGAGCHSNPATCNGDGSGRIDPHSGERWMVWRHLSLAEILPGDYTGVSEGATGYLPGVNMPESSIDGSGYSLYHFDGIYQKDGFYIELARDDGGTFDGNVLSVARTSLIDKKYDDGLADRGFMYATTGGGGTGQCVANAWNDASSGAYDLSNEGKLECELFFVVQKM